MGLFSTTLSSHIPRRAFLFMPFAFAGLVAISFRKDHPLPDPAEGGSGAKVTLVIFSDNGERKNTIEVGRIVKTDAEWQRELTAEEFAVARKKGTERAFTGRYSRPDVDAVRGSARLEVARMMCYQQKTYRAHFQHPSLHESESFACLEFSLGAVRVATACGRPTPAGKSE